MKIRRKVRKISLCFVALAWLVGCKEEYTPKPRGYFRLEVPDSTYSRFSPGNCPYSFEMNNTAQWIDKTHCWGDVYYPSIKARMQLTYKPVNPDNLDTLLRDGQELAMKHQVKADGMQERLYQNPEQSVYGILYRIQGDAATSTQFFVTDSVDHFLRGVLYFYAPPNADSLKPVNDFMYDETVRLVETLQWQNWSP
ncbi:MAG TPA: gliding motility lipoprotein GldD [Cryomorphaceae bacterium]|nr:gliding motility lipoprotein GldD [Owenweeksia sp.]MBF97461.1 gliding motility lipoprotein GldD [Owenweeksia sp.]HAD96023.1 gliding motility lipoprotein GldD [Cryomorphaceae bacterium]HBF20406.1 gliding motility lipoprotein GldD [Cryomorphaceae bacterium]HCQ16370.1 gliding motility lipoprotein GldD [Cryomorphaceae bacterium]